MKKSSKLMRASGILLVLTLITSCFVGGTFAKYVSTGDGSDTARVAKWGVEVEVTGDAFKTTYTNDDVDSKITNVVNSNEKVVAPGTYGTFSGVRITGTPEVAVKVTTVADFELGENWTDKNGNYYCPIVINVNGTQFCGLDYDDANAFESAIEGAINGYISDSYAAGTDLSKETELNSSIQWRWAYDKNTLDDTPGDTFAFSEEVKSILTDQDDAKDSDLGNKAADGEKLNITLGLETTVTQID